MKVLITLISLNGMSRLFSSFESNPRSRAASLKFLFVAANAFMILQKVLPQRKWDFKLQIQNEEYMYKDLNDDIQIFWRDKHVTGIYKSDYIIQLRPYWIRTISIFNKINIPLKNCMSCHHPCRMSTLCITCFLNFGGIFSSQTQFLLEMQCTWLFNVNLSF